VVKYLFAILVLLLPTLCYANPSSLTTERFPEMPSQPPQRLGFTIRPLDPMRRVADAKRFFEVTNPMPETGVGEITRSPALPQRIPQAPSNLTGVVPEPAFTAFVFGLATVVAVGGFRRFSQARFAAARV
jgi:hypothetical protein